MYLLDTDICSYLMSGGYSMLTDRVERIPRRDISVSSISHAEIWYGLSKKQVGLRRRVEAKLFLDSFQASDWPVSASDTYGRIRAQLERIGQRLEEHDLMIAAHAIAIDAILVTNNTRHFSRISPPLKLENWLES